MWCWCWWPPPGCVYVTICDRILYPGIVWQRVLYFLEVLCCLITSVRSLCCFDHNYINIIITSTSSSHPYPHQHQHHINITWKSPYAARHTPHRIISHLVPYLISSHLISSHHISSRLISSHLISSHLVSSHPVVSKVPLSHLSSHQSTVHT